MEETRTRSKERTFYIRVANLAIENGKPLFVGPFESQEEAEGIINQAMYNGQELMEGDEYINDKTLNVTIVGGTAAKREGMKDPLNEMPQVENWVSYFPAGDIYKSNRGRPKKDEQVEEEVTEETRMPTRASRQPAKFIQPKTSAAPRTVSKKNPEIVIVTSSMAIVNWLSSQGIKGEIKSRINHPREITGKIVIGVIPAWLAIFAEKFGIINIPGVKAGDLESMTPEEMDKRGTHIDFYKTVKLDE